MTPEETLFDTNARLLFNHLIKTIELSDSFALKLGRPNSLLTSLKKYINIYEGTKPCEHFEYFEALFNKNKLGVLNTMRSDRWLRDGKVVVRWGDGIPDTSQHKCIMLSAIYKKACDLRDDIEGNGDKDCSDRMETILPDILLLHLFRMMAVSVQNEEDKEKLAKIVKEMETILSTEPTEDISLTPSTFQNPMAP